MNNYYSPMKGVKVKPRTSISPEHFLKSINKLASRDSFSPIEEKQPVQSKYINRGSPIKVCTQCRVPLVAGENITQHRYDRFYFLCAGCFSAMHRQANKNRSPAKQLAFKIKRKKVSLQKRITKLMDQLAYINAMGIK